MPVAAETSRAGGAGARTRPNRGLTATLAAIGPLFAGYALPFAAGPLPGPRRGAATTSSSAARSGSRSGGWCCWAPPSACFPSPGCAAAGWVGARAAGRLRGLDRARHLVVGVAASAASPSSAAWPPTSGCSRWPSGVRAARACGGRSARVGARRSPFSGSWPCSPACTRAGSPRTRPPRLLPSTAKPPQLSAQLLERRRGAGRRSACRCCLASRRPRATIAARALAAAAVPALALAAFYTLSRGGALEIAVGAGRRCSPSTRAAWRCSPAWRPAAAGGAILIVAATQRDALEDGLGSRGRAVPGRRDARDGARRLRRRRPRAGGDLARRTPRARARRFTSPAAAAARLGGGRRRRRDRRRPRGRRSRASSPTAGRSSSSRSAPRATRRPSASRAPAATAATSTGSRRSTRTRPSPWSGSGPGPSSSGGRARARSPASSATPTPCTSRRWPRSGSSASR